MDKDRIKGALDKTKGSIKEGVGKAIGNRKLEAEGKLDKAKGKVEGAYGKAKDKIRDITR